MFLYIFIFIFFSFISKAHLFIHTRTSLAKHWHIQPNLYATRISKSPEFEHFSFSLLPYSLNLFASIFQAFSTFMTSHSWMLFWIFASEENLRNFILFATAESVSSRAQMRAPISFVRLYIHTHSHMYIFIYVYGESVCALYVVRYRFKHWNALKYRRSINLKHHSAACCQNM